VTSLDTLIRNHRAGGPLERAFYVAPEIFAADTDRILRRHWLFAGPGCSIPKPGDWFTWSVAGDSVIVLRDQQGAIRAYYNTCRHRGSRICREETGHATSLVCPYHAWAYGLDGRLLVNIDKEFGIDRAGIALHKVQVREVEGLIFLSLADNPPDFRPIERDVAHRLRPHGLNRAKVAHAIDYTVRANWKLVFENNRECYHCPPNHEEYNAATYDVARDMALLNPRLQAEIDARVAECNARFRALGLDEGDAKSSMTGAYWRAHRTPLMQGFTTQSMDGKPVAPLMGDFTERDAGTLRITIFPNFWQHANDDYACATRITPVSATECQIRVMWLVHRDAVEGRDYTLDRLLPIWQRTSEQDWRICEDQQIGVSSSRYVPGPYSLLREQNVAHFVQWYLGELSGPGALLKTA
jgi:phenylpropionate dioxygenase-like ring-hydroxylating dioxygenase large terminal subunit